MRHIADGVEKHESAQGGAHESEQDAERVDMQNQGKRPVPMEEIEVDRLPCMNQRHSCNHSSDRR